MVKILIIEDEEYILEMYKIKFEASGFEVFTATNGQDGFDKAKSVRPDIVLLDLVMPVLDGYQSLALMRSEGSIKDMKIYILSNLGQQEEIVRGMDLGANGFLVKASMTPSELVEKVKSLLGEADAVGKKVDVPKGKSAKKLTAKIKIVDTGKTKILFIEDNKVIADMYELGLCNAGYDPIVAENGLWGVRMATEQKFDIIIMDMNMPAMNGFDMLRQIKADSQNKDTYIIVLSNSAQDEDIARAKSVGANRYLLKATITPKKLIKEIEKIFK